MATILEDYVSFETAKLLKEKGFDESIRCWYDNFQDFHEEGVRMCNTDCLPPTIMCPTLQMAMKWLREVHGIVICVSILNENNKGNDDYSNPDRWWYFFDIINAKGVYNEELQPNPLSNEYSTYEEAAEAAIKYCLENLI